MTDLTAEREAPGHDQGPDSGFPDRHERLPAAPSSALPGGVELTRLISLARLTPAQALEIGASVLGEAAGAPDTGSPEGGRVVIDQVVVEADGRVVLGPAADGRHNGRHNGRPSAAGPTGRAVEAVLADVAGAARLRARRADPAAGQLRAELDRAVADRPVAGVPVVARMLQEAAAAIDRGAVRAELGALVQAIGGQASPVSAGAPAGGRGPRPGGGPRGSARPRQGPPRTGRPPPRDGGSARGCSRSWSSPRSSCWRSSSCATASPPTSACCWTPDVAGRRRHPRRSPTACGSWRPPLRRPAA